ncbi:MAG: DUF6973 domain-containing protein [Pseudomonadota bacterium]
MLDILERGAAVDAAGAFPGDADRQNAFRHALWMARLSSALGGANPYYGAFGNGAARTAGAVFEAVTGLPRVVAGLAADAVPALASLGLRAGHAREDAIDSLVDLNNNELGLGTVADLRNTRVCRDGTCRPLTPQEAAQQAEASLRRRVSGGTRPTLFALGSAPVSAPSVP